MSDRRSLLPSRDASIDGIAVLVLSTIAVFAFQSSYGGLEFLLLGVAASLLGIVVAHLGLTFRWPLVVTIAVAVVVYAVIGGAASLHERAIAGVIPSPDSTLAALRTGIVGWKDLITTAPPVGRTGDLMVLPFLAGYVSGLAGYFMARRFRSGVPATLVPAGVLGVGIASGTDQPVSPVLHGCVFAAVAIGWLAWKESHRRPLLEGARASRRQLITGAGVMVVAAAVGVVLADHLPFADQQERSIWRQTVTPPFDPNRYPSPLSGYRRYVKDAAVKDQVMFTVEGLPEGVPVRLATMDAYDGLVWQVSGGDRDNPSLADSGSFERVGASLPPDFGGDTATVTVTIDKYSDVWIPDVGEVVSLRFEGSADGPDRDRQLADAFRYNRSTDTGASRVRLHAGDRYEMEVRLPTQVDSFSGQELIPVVPQLGLSRVVPDVAQKLQGDVLSIKDTGERLDTMRALMLEGTYSDGDRSSGQQGSRAGHSAFRLTEFVNQYPKLPLIGNAEQYSATFALLFRDLDHLPTRVVMGFVPPKASTAGPVEVLARDVEAWVEVPVEKVGWTAIFPTPPRDQLALTASADQQPQPDYRTQNPPPPPLIDPEFEESATAAGKAKSTKKSEPPKAAEPEAGDEGILGGPIGLAAKVVGLPVLLILGACMVIVLLKVRRRQRRRSTGAPHVRVANGWREVTDLALDMGRPVPSTTTRREASQFVGAGTSELASKADAFVWGREEPTDQEVEEYWDDLSTALRSMKSEVGVVDRFKAAVSLRSLKLRQRVSRKGGTR